MRPLAGRKGNESLYASTGSDTSSSEAFWSCGISCAPPQKKQRLETHSGSAQGHDCDLAGGLCRCVFGWKWWDTPIDICHRRVIHHPRGRFDLNYSLLFIGQDVFWTWTCFVDPAIFVSDLGARKMRGTCMCVFCSLWGYFFFGPACICAGPRDFCFQPQIIWFLFFGPVHLLCGPWLHRVGGELHCYMRSHWAWCFWTLAPFFTCTCFFDMAQGGGNLDIEPRCMQEVVDGGEVRILKQHKCKKRWRGRRGGSLRMKRHGCKKLRGTWGEEKVRYWNKMSATSCWEMRDEA